MLSPRIRFWYEFVASPHLPIELPVLLNQAEWGNAKNGSFLTFTLVVASFSNKIFCI